MANKSHYTSPNECPYFKHLYSLFAHSNLLPVDFQSDFPSILIFNCRKTWKFFLKRTATQSRNM